jgi:hypothetical protein
LAGAAHSGRCLAALVSVVASAKRISNRWRI